MEPASTPTRRALAALVIVGGAVVAVLGLQSPASSSSDATGPAGVIPAEERRALGVPSIVAPDGPTAPRRLERTPALGEGDGLVPDGTTVASDGTPAVANLDSALLGALRQAAADAADHGVEVFIDSGWRSPEYQEQLYREAVSRYGSEVEAARWVATPNTSAHVSGDAVDIGQADAMAWLSEHGSAYGLCQIYGNEPWHYELRPDAIDHGCPPPYANAAHDPRMQH